MGLEFLPTFNLPGAPKRFSCFVFLANLQGAKQQPPKNPLKQIYNRP